MSGLMFVVLLCAINWTILRSFNPWWFYYRHTRTLVAQGVTSGVLPVTPGYYLMRYAGPIAVGLSVATEVVIFWATLWALAPLLVWNRQTHAAGLEFLPIEPGGPRDDPRVADRLREAGEELRGLGFLPRGAFRLRRGGRGTTSYVAVFEKADTGEAAKLVAVTAGRVFHHSINFISEYEDKTTFTTSNSRVAPVTPRLPGHPDSMAFPQVRDARTLYEVHRARGPRDARPVGVGDDLPAYLARSEGRAFPHWIASGYYYLDESARVYRPTWKGACLMTWKSLWPVSALRRALRMRKASRALRQLGVA
jgi:hypothetical protein